MRAYLKALDCMFTLPLLRNFILVMTSTLTLIHKSALRHTLSKDYLSLISHCDSAFVVLNTLTSPKEQMTYVLEKESSGDKSDQACFMVQGNASLEVKSDTHLDGCANSSDDHC